MRLLRPADPKIDVTVCVVNWNGAQWLPDCLRALGDDHAVRLEVFVVDNASQDESVKIVRESFPTMKLIVNNENAGYAKGNNQAIVCGRGRNFLLLNNDAVLESGAAERLVHFLDQHPKAGMAAGRLLNADGSTQYTYYPVSLPSLASMAADLLWLNRLSRRNRIGRGALARNWDPEMPYRMEQLPGACLLVRREVFEGTGLLDERYRFWYEDVDFCARAFEAGWELWYVPEAKILHHGGESSKLLGEASRSLLRFQGMLRYAAEHFRRGHFLLLKSVVALVLVVRLPAVMVAGLWPGAAGRRWKGTWRAYLQLLREVVLG
jgi:GT2 family glycosyltransferase